MCVKILISFFILLIVLALPLFYKPDFFDKEGFSNYYLAYTESNKILLNITRNEFDNSIFTCAFYKTLLRGRHQKIISYSLYGKNKLYYNLLT